MFKNVRRLGWIILYIIFLSIPALFGLFIFHYGLITSGVLPCALPTIWNFLWTCLFGTYAMSLVTGSFIIAILVSIFFIVNIKNSQW